MDSFKILGMWIFTSISTLMIIIGIIELYDHIEKYIKKWWVSLIISIAVMISTIIAFLSCIYYISEELFYIILIIFFGGYISIFGG